MRETKFTPGPWDLKVFGLGYQVHSGRMGGPMKLDYNYGPVEISVSGEWADTPSGHRLIAQGSHTDQIGDRSLANFRLMTAAPDLYAALDNWLSLRDDVAAAGGMDGPLGEAVIERFARRQHAVVNAARAALQRARGETP